MSERISVKQATLEMMKTEDYYAQAAAAVIGVVAGLLGGLFIL